jgi:4-carboxymuconolactone decarboxylase
MAGSTRASEERTVPENVDLDAARALRRAVLGDTYVDAQAADANPAMGEFQDYVTAMAWGVWARGGALSVRTAAWWSWP